MKKLLIGLSLLVTISNQASSKVIKNPNMELTFISSWGYELTKTAFFSCNSDLDLVCKNMNSSYTRARDFECSIMKMNTVKNLISSSFSYINNGIDRALLTLSNIGCEEDNNCMKRQWFDEPGKEVVLYNLQERNEDEIEDMRDYPYTPEYGKKGDISTERLRNSYYEKAYAENDVEHLSSIECLKD